MGLMVYIPFSIVSFFASLSTEFSLLIFSLVSYFHVIFLLGCVAFSVSHDPYSEKTTYMFVK
jgi:hypothetical protein